MRWLWFLDPFPPSLWHTYRFLIIIWEVSRFAASRVTLKDAISTIRRLDIIIHLPHTHTHAHSSVMSEGLRPSPAVDEPPTFQVQSTASAWSQLDASAWSAAAALVFATIAYHLSSQQSELTSELLCWILLPIIFIISKRYRNADTHTGALPAVNALAEPAVNGTHSSSSLWLVALCLALCSAFKAEKGIIILFVSRKPSKLIAYTF